MTTAEELRDASTRFVRVLAPDSQHEKEITMTIEETIQAAEILRAAQTTAKVAYLLESGDVAYGTARSVGNDRGAFARNGEDVRDLFLRVTTQSGLEAFLPVRELMPKVSSGEFCLYDWS